MKYVLPAIFSLMGFGAMITGLSSIPSLEELRSVTGISDLADTSSYTVHGNRKKPLFIMSLENDDRVFACKSREPGYDRLKKTVRRGDTLQIWFVPGDVFKGYYITGQVVANGMVILDYKNIGQKKREIQNIRLVFGAFTGICGGFLVFLIRRLDKRPRWNGIT